MSVDAAAGRLVLAVDASTYVGSVAVLDASGAVLAAREAAMRGEHEERLMPAVADALLAAGATVRDVGAVVCGAGPGSFTSLRIAASIAKGTAVGRAVPLHAVSSLWLVAAAQRPPLAAGRYVAALAAMRGEWFAQRLDVAADGSIREDGAWRLAARADLDAEAASGGRVLGPDFGGERPLAAGAGLLVPRLGRDWLPVDLDSWEPDYGRKAEAQVRWEAEHGRPLDVAGATRDAATPG